MSIVLMLSSCTEMITKAKHYQVSLLNADESIKVSVIQEPCGRGVFEEIQDVEGVYNIDIPALKGGGGDIFGIKFSYHNPEEYKVVNICKDDKMIIELSINEIEKLPKDEKGVFLFDINELSDKSSISEKSLSESQDSNFVGKYVFEYQTINKDIKEFKNLSTNEILVPKIEIMKNGEYMVENLPYISIKPTFVKYITQKGYWEKSVVGLGGYKMEPLTGIKFNGISPGPSSALLSCDSTNISRLIFVIGDPDAKMEMVFKKN